MDRTTSKGSIMKRKSSSSCNGVGDCYWRKEYFRLREEFDRYKKKISGELCKVGIMESKLLIWRNQTENIKTKMLEEMKKMATKTEELQDEKNKAFQEGVETTRQETLKNANVLQNIRHQAEMDFLTAQTDLLLLNRQKEWSSTELEHELLEKKRNICSLEQQNKALEEDIEKIRKEAQSTISTYREQKNKAMDDYTSLHKDYIDYVDRTKKDLKYAAETNERYQMELDRLTSVSMAVKATQIDQLEAQTSSVAVNTVQEDVIPQILKFFEIHTTWSLSLYSGLSEELENKIKELSEVVEYERYKNQALVGNAKDIRKTMKSILRDTCDTLLKLDAERKEALAIRNKVETDLATAVNSLQGVNQQLFKFTREITNLLHNVIKAAGIPPDIVDSLHIDELIDFKTHYAMGGNDNPEVVKSFSEVKVEEEKFTKVTDAVKMWKKMVKGQQHRLRDRQLELERQVEAEKLGRFKDNEIAMKKLRLYKALIFKLRGRVDDAVKKAARYREEQLLSGCDDEDVMRTLESKRRHDAISFRFNEFKYILERAADSLKEVENTELAAATKVAMPFSRSNSF